MSYICDTCPGGDCDNCRYHDIAEVRRIVHPDIAHHKAINAFAVADKARRIYKPLSPTELDLPVPRMAYQYVSDEVDYGTPIVMPINLILEIWKNNGSIE